MNTIQKFSSKTPGRAWLVIFTWFCWISSFSIAAPVPPCPGDCECSFNRDGLQIATCIDTQWNEISYPNIHVLTLRPSDVEIVCNIPKDLSLLFPQLNFLTLKNCSLTYIPSNTFRKLKSLQEVDLSHNSIRKFSPSLFTANTKLRYVNLERNPLNISPHALLTSSSIWEVNLAACDLSRLPPSAFKGLPNLRYLSLADNKLQTITENTLPSGLKTLNLSGNNIVNIPLSELNRLKGLNKIDLSHNPVNCTCQLIGFQEWFSGKGTIFRNQIRCAYPPEYAGYSLSKLPQYQMCDAKVQLGEQITSNQIQLNDGYLMDEQYHNSTDDDQFLFDVDKENVVGKDEKYHSVVEGSGNDDVDADGSGEQEDTDSSHKNENLTTVIFYDQNTTVPTSISDKNANSTTVIFNGTSDSLMTSNDTTGNLVTVTSNDTASNLVTVTANDTAGNLVTVTSNDTASNLVAVTSNDTTGNLVAVTSNDTIGNLVTVTSNDTAGNLVTVTSNDTTSNLVTVTSNDTTGNLVKVTSNDTTGNSVAVTSNDTIGNLATVISNDTAGNLVTVTSNDTTSNLVTLTSNDTTGNLVKVTSNDTTGNSVAITSNDTIGNLVTVTSNDTAGNLMTVTSNDTTSSLVTVTSNDTTGNLVKVTSNDTTGNLVKVTSNDTTGNLVTVTSNDTTGNLKAMASNDITDNIMAVTSNSTADNLSAVSSNDANGNSTPLTSNEANGNSTSTSNENSNIMPLINDKFHVNGKSNLEVVESNVSSSTNSTTINDQGTVPTLFYGNNDSESSLLKPASSDSNASLPKQENIEAIETTELPEASNNDEVTTLRNGTIHSDSNVTPVTSEKAEMQKTSKDIVTQDPLTSSDANVNNSSMADNVSSVATAPDSLAKDTSTEQNGTPTETSSSGPIIPAQVSNSTKEHEDLSFMLQTDVKNEITNTDLTKSNEMKNRDLEAEAHPNTLPPTKAFQDEGSSYSAPTVIDEEATKATTPPLDAGVNENSTTKQSTETPVHSQITKNQSSQNLSKARFIIPALLIVAVLLICLSIYFSQHNCRAKSWNQSEPKTGNPTELQDVSLLGPDGQQPDSDLYSKKYESEGENAQTEKLMNGDGGGGGDHADRSNGISSASKSPLTNDNVPEIKKRTTRVTTNYESLPRSPIIINKS